ncbi:Modification methylase bstVI [uncultured Candidatus Thioglobus sp.]|nr:Modification methylase bstVI [uncultured Candidatus Thioglobus sp.]
MNIQFNSITSELNISNATLRNWIKTDCLTTDRDGFITTESYDYFKKNILGKDKLNKRANKQYLDKPNIDFSIDENNNAHESAIQYEQSLSIAERNKKGIYYTPNSSIDEMFSALPILKATDTFLDPCCGTGNFLIKALEKGIKPENIYGFDVDKTALKIANNRFYQLTGQHSNNIKLVNLLEEKHNQKYDFIFTNPPWGYKFNAQQKTYYANRFNKGVKVDSSALFVLICLNIIQKDGMLGVLLPDSFFNIAAFKSVRKVLLKKSLVQLINHNKPFEGLQTKAYSFIVKNNSDLIKIQCKTDTSKQFRKQTDFINNPHYIINFDATEMEAQVISHLYSYPHQTLTSKAKWGLGIVTGNNAKHLSNTKKNNHKPIYKGVDIEKGKIKKHKFYIFDDFSKLQQTADKKLYLADKKIVYRFINSNLIFALDDKQRYFLNSVNFLIINQHTLLAEDKLAITEQQLVFLMNAEIMNWLFKKLFRTHKVLRSDLERLPIFDEFFRIHNNYCEQDLHKYLNIERHNGTFRIKT